MKKIEAIVREDTFTLVKSALEEKGFISMTVSDVIGRGRQKGVTLKLRGGEQRIEFLPKKKIEMVVDDEDYPVVVDIICDKAKTGAIGDGKIFVMPVENVIRVRTGETDAVAV